ncbi:MAG: extracellular solute-binding protein [Candidatus Viridilinea halotolerans]|uniref:Extracellular solute-binding protein n=1 Tax=Candidatus Viridilinea halotolerans TaxID=2491704 RepID=A0A426TVU7_9CHLR|nr:MAG: extracellular solute-binding protein [Candidatus Viridilinea halotolerans]
MPTPAAPSRGVIILWHAWPAPVQRALAVSVERFNRNNPDVQVVLQSRPAASLRDDFIAAVAEGGGPHMALLPSHTLGYLVESGTIRSVEALLATDTRNQILPVALGATQVETAAGWQLYGLPISFDTLALYYNTANFTGAPPNDSVALLAAARGLSNPSGDPPLWGLAYNLSLDRTIGYLYAFEGQIFDAQGQVALGLEGRTGGEAWLAWLATLRDDPHILASFDGIAVDSALRSQQALMTIDWAHALPTYSALWPDSLGVAPLPQLNPGGGVPRPYLQSETLVVNVRLGSAAEERTVSAFARHMLSEATQRELLHVGQQPVLMSLDLEWADPNLSAELRAAASAFRLQATSALPMPNSRTANEAVRNILLDMHSSAVRRLISPSQAVESADAALREAVGPP